MRVATWSRRAPRRVEWECKTRVSPIWRVWVLRVLRPLCNSPDLKQPNCNYVNGLYCSFRHGLGSLPNFVRLFAFLGMLQRKWPNCLPSERPVSRPNAPNPSRQRKANGPDIGRKWKFDSQNNYFNYFNLKKTRHFKTHRSPLTQLFDHGNGSILLRQCIHLSMAKFIIYNSLHLTVTHEQNWIG